MRHPRTPFLVLLVASALGSACGGTEDSTSDQASGGSPTGGRATTGAGAPSGEGGSSTATGGRASGGLTAGGSGATSTGGAPPQGGSNTGGAAAGGSGGSATGATNAGGSGGSLTGGRNAGGSGGSLLGGAGGTPVGGSGGTLTGGMGNVPAGGAGGGLAGGAGGVLGGGTGGGSGTGGSGGRVVCGVQICDAGEICCGPAECGYCINALSGANCPDVCLGTGGAGGAAGVCPTNYTIPDLDRTCTTSTDCFLGAHWADCCGSRVAVSFSNTELAAFTAAEAACSPACACAESAPLAEDGAPLATLAEAVAECVDGQCIARGPQHAGTCLTGDVCIDTNAEGDCAPAPGSLGAGICRGSAGRCFYCDCAAPDTPIATPTGDRPIAELRVGDLVYSVEGEATVVVPIARVNQRRVESHYVVEVRLEGGTTLHISAGHPTADGRTFADLTKGGQLGGHRVMSADFVPYPHAYTHDILPASSTGAYYAGGVLIGSTLSER